MGSRNYWVISDTHFGHENILTFKDSVGKPQRPFKTVEEMNEYMVDRWNSVVAPGDYVYHLGDVFFGPKEDFSLVWSRLKGKKRLIVGNHDDIPWLVTNRDKNNAKFFQKIALWRMLKDFNALLTHVPVDPSTVREKRFEGVRMLNVHGHIHSNPSPTWDHYCVSVEQINYTPMNLEEIRDIAKYRS
ncbi:metallophophesterase [Bacteriophage DSS3_PM1]|nr:metallophophesterase [Bacteriophage DSS3_PM1]